jgi:tripartite-type tricarboxylate transporter receptor subunit TctC
LPGLEAVAWHGFFVPAATPKPIVEKLSTAIRAFMQQPDTVQKMAELGAVAVALEPEAFAAYIASETARWKKSHRSRQHQDGLAVLRRGG